MENLQKAIDELRASPTVNIHGKHYTQVSTRINIFRKYFGDASLETEITYSDEFRVVIKAVISIDNKVIATGFAEELRSNNDNSINSTSMIEVCETSAIGRALANFGLGGSEYASSYEVANAVAQQQSSSNHYQNKQQNHSQANSVSNSQSYDVLSNLGLNIVTQNDGTAIVTGNNAYEYRQIIKQHGFKWTGKQWQKASNTMAA